MVLATGGWKFTRFDGGGDNDNDNDNDDDITGCSDAEHPDVTR